MLPMFLVLFFTLFLSAPIGIAIVSACLTATVTNPEVPLNLNYIFRNMVSGIDSYPLLAIPLFILSGVIMARGGISKKLFDFFAFFVGDKTAGMPITVIITCLFYGAISGSSPATTAAVGAMAIPLLVNLGYDRVFVTALVATAGGLGVIIPPSIPFIVYGLASSASVGKLFIAGIIPGILIGLCLMVYSWIYCRSHGEDKNKLKQNAARLRARGFIGTLMDSFWALLTPVFILGGIYGGIVTPTEAANVSVIYSLVVSIYIYKTLAWKDIPEVLREAVKTFAPMMLVVAAATVFTRTLTMLNIPQTIVEVMSQALVDKVMFLLCVNLILLVVGMFMEPLTSILILTPILFPLVTSFGVDPIHFGVIMVVNLAIGFVTPPVGVNLYVASGMTGISVMSIAKKAVPFLVAFFIALILITFIPWLSLALL
ncbi:TRAP transporter, DctM subunit [uncultured delta proteobacterium]|uniref:TRAP transporter, DctM subunit n=1 Tax=uncultured delta proteobacterium TaxID=34034 RepID=A0A212KBA0_9DELT|nr:TRAP transporter, DctM subunit [uncultured delta proteobacterium]